MTAPHFRPLSLGILSLVLLASACRVQQPSALPSSSADPRAETTFSDPFAYCTAVDTVDAPDSRYVGPQVPDRLIDGMKEAGVISDGIPVDIVVSATAWRCFNGEVWACFVGANLPCTAKADTSTTPSPAVVDYCSEQPNSEFIPAAVTGRETVFEWRCADGAPQIVRQVLQPDARGFLSEFWHRVRPVDPTRSGGGT
jgi:hypothetical protein